VASSPDEVATVATDEHFTRMDESTRDQWMRILTETQAHQASVPAYILGMLRSLDRIVTGFGVSQLRHACQTATLARRANAPDEVVLASLCHDMGKAISISGHGEISAAILRPYVSDDVYKIVLTHQDFQGRHYYGWFDKPTNLREQYRSQPWFARAEQFTDEWDQVAFDPNYRDLPLEEFEPLVQQFFGKFVI
jgi:predicted HD phosphohydrolase